MNNPTTTATEADTERADLLDALAAARAKLVATTADLSDEQLGAQPTASSLCLGGLVKHVASVERGWQRFILEGPDGLRYDLPEGVTWADLANGTAREYPQWAIEHQNGFRMQPGDTRAAVVADLEAVAARTAEIVASVELSTAYPLPEAPWNPPGEVRSVRRVLIQLVSEISQHAGHADILRESLDGRTAGF